MSSVNKVHLLGVVSKEPEIRSFPSGGRMATMTVTTSESYKDKEGVEKERSEYNKVSIFNEKTVETIIRYVTKGSRVWIEGALETRKWKDKEGKEHYMTEVVVRPFNGKLTLMDDAAATKETKKEAPTQPALALSKNEPEIDLDDSIPF